MFCEMLSQKKKKTKKKTSCFEASTLILALRKQMQAISVSSWSSEFQARPNLHSEFQDSLIYTHSELKGIQGHTVRPQLKQKQFFQLAVK